MLSTAACRTNLVGAATEGLEHGSQHHLGSGRQVLIVSRPSSVGLASDIDGSSPITGT